MFELRCQIDESLARRLEDHFCEWVRSPWMLLRAKPEDEYRLSGYFDTAEEAREGWAELRGVFAELPSEFEEHPVQEKDWKETYKEHFKPFRMRDLHWVPLWERDSYAVPDGHAAVYLDPGMAFGTGDHPTTRLCAERLLDFREERPVDFAESRVIDVGCGSGILSLSAAKLGYRHVFGFDVDPEAVRVSRENAEINGVADLAEFAHADASDALGERSADLVLANIWFETLCEHCGPLLNALCSRGVLVMSGILKKETAGVRACFEKALKKKNAPYALDERISGEWADICVRLRQS